MSPRCSLCEDGCGFVFSVFQEPTVLLNPVLGHDIPTPAVDGFGHKLEENFCSMNADILCFLKDA